MISISCCIPGGSFVPNSDGSIPVSSHDVLISGFRTLTEMGYDTAEAAVGMIRALSEEEIEDLHARYEAGTFRLDVCNCLIPGEFPIYTDEEGTKRLYAYIDDVFRRMSRLGVRYVVFGSGGARRLPEGADPDRHRRLTDAFLTYCNERCGDCGLTLLIEPLNHRETNWIYTVSEGAALVRRLNLPHIRLLADSYHMSVENEDLSAVLSENRDIVLHAHIAAPEDRGYPGKGAGTHETAFLNALKDIGYDGIVTVESLFGDFKKEAKAALVFIDSVLGDSRAKKA